MERKLVTVQRIDDVQPIPDADRIEKVRVLGWWCVVNKGKFKVGDLCIYFEIDSWIPKYPWNEFLFDGSNKVCTYEVDGVATEGVVLRTKKMRGQISQGLVMPISVLYTLFITNRYTTHHFLKPYLENAGSEVTAFFGVRKEEVNDQIAGEVVGFLPVHITSTSIERVQNIWDTVLSKYRRYEDTILFDYVEKLDGTSMSVSYNRDADISETFSVCGRGYQYKIDTENHITRTAKRLNLCEVLSKISNDFDIDRIVLQGELIGPGIRKNIYKIENHEFRVFTIELHYNTSSNKNLTYTEMESFKEVFDSISHFPLLLCPIVHRSTPLPDTLDTLLSLADFKSLLNNTTNAEGLVVRPSQFNINDSTIGRLSFKVISNKFLLKYKENA